MDWIIKFNFQSGYYLPNAEILHENYRVATPRVEDMQPFGYYIYMECKYFDTYRLVRDNQPFGQCCFLMLMFSFKIIKMMNLLNVNISCRVPCDNKCWKCLFMDHDSWGNWLRGRNGHTSVTRHLFHSSLGVRRTYHVHRTWNAIVSSGFPGYKRRGIQIFIQINRFKNEFVFLILYSDEQEIVSVVSDVRKFVLPWRVRRLHALSAVDGLQLNILVVGEHEIWSDCRWIVG